MRDRSPGGEAAEISSGRVYIIVVNWNGWQDTIECLESVFRLTYSNYVVVVCDNGSMDGSLDQVRRWAEGDMAATSRSKRMAALTLPVVAKPLSFSCMKAVRPTAVSGGEDVRLVLIEIGTNLGFAGANNVGLAYGLTQPDCASFWLLNNDTVVAPDSLSHLIARMNQTPRPGLCGSTLLFYDDPGRVQACGGSRYNPWTSRGGHIAAGQDAGKLPEKAWVEDRLRYIIGASMLVSRQFVESVGLMNEKYFLYFEEVDWATRARGLFRLAYAPLSVVYHKTGGTIGSAAHPVFQSEMADFWGTRNRIVFTRNYFKYALPSVYLFILCSALLRLAYGRVKNFRAIVAGAFELSAPDYLSTTVKSATGAVPRV